RDAEARGEPVDQLVEGPRRWCGASPHADRHRMVFGPPKRARRMVRWFDEHPDFHAARAKHGGRLERLGRARAAARLAIERPRAVTQRYADRTGRGRRKRQERFDERGVVPSKALDAPPWC